MNKRKKIIRIILIIISCLCVCKLADATSYLLVKTKAELYLCSKYDAKPSQIDLIDYKRAHPYFQDNGLFFDDLKWDDFSFEFKYNDKSFFVNRYNGKFYDDYQLEDIEKWCTDWLKENVDKRIIGFDLESLDMYYYQYETDKDRCRKLSEEDAEDFLNNYSLHYSKGYRYGTCIHYYDKRQEEDFNLQEEIIIEEKLYDKLTLGEYVNLYFTENDMRKSVVKPKEESWYKWITALC